MYEDSNEMRLWKRSVEGCIVALGREGEIPSAFDLVHAIDPYVVDGETFKILCEACADDPRSVITANKLSEAQNCPSREVRRSATLAWHELKRPEKVFKTLKLLSKPENAANAAAADDDDGFVPGEEELEGNVWLGDLVHNGSLGDDPLVKNSLVFAICLNCKRTDDEVGALRFLDALSEKGEKIEGRSLARIIDLCGHVVRRVGCRGEPLLETSPLLHPRELHREEERKL